MGDDDFRDELRNRKPSLEKLLKYGGDPNSLSFEESGQRRTLLCLSIEEGVQLDCYSKVDLLLAAKADPNRRCETGSFPLELAVKHKDLSLARKLLRYKADANQQDAKLVTPLHRAAHQDQAEIVQLLLLHKANVNAVDKVGQPPVFFAMSRDVAVQLLEAEADVLHLNNKGQSALHLAAHNGSHEATMCFTDIEQLRHLVDLPDEFGRTALHHAAARGHLSCVSRLMDVGADPRLKTKNGQTPMTLADAKDMDVAYYIYTRMTGGNRSTWREMAQNPIALTLAAVVGVACIVNSKLLWEFSCDLVAVYLG